MKRRREELGISQEEMAARYRAVSGETTTRDTYRRWESHGRVDVERARFIAEVLGVSVSWLLLGE